MRESIKVVSVVVFFTSTIIALVVWTDDRPSDSTWVIRVASPVIAATALGLFLGMHFQRDRAPDFLRQSFPAYFDRAGLAFAIDAIAQEGVCFFRAHFQNQYSRPCRGRIVLRPARGFFLRRADLQHIAFDIDCPAAGFGMARVPVAIDRSFQGKRQKFDVGASVTYSEGRGRMLRFRSGLLIRSDSAFNSPFGSALTLAGAMTGHIILHSPASVVLTLPIDVAEELPVHLVPDSKVIWQVDDPSPAAT